MLLQIYNIDSFESISFIIFLPNFTSGHSSNASRAISNFRKATYKIKFIFFNHQEKNKQNIDLMV